MNRQRPRAPLALFLALIAVGGVSFATRGPAATTVALVSTCGGQAGQNVLALAEAKLSAQKGVALADRTLVERILDEQKLAHCGLSDSTQALAVGKLLGVEVFATLETLSGSEEALGLVVFDARSGAKLWDATLPAGGTEETADGIVTAVGEACAKRLRPTANLRTVCLLSVRNAELPRGMDSFCESVGQLLERRLLGSASLAVLERERLEQINRERDLPTSELPNDLLPSLTLLELEFSRGSESNGVKTTVFLTDASGASLGKIRAVGSIERVTDLVDALLQRLTQTLKATPSVRNVDRPREAQRFRQEANYLIDQDQPAKALQAVEAAYALDPNDKESRPLLAQTLLAVASGSIGARDLHGQPQQATAAADNMKRALTMAARAADLCLEIRAATTSAGEPRRFPETKEEMALYYFLVGACPKAGSCDDESRRELVDLQGRFRRMLVEMWEQPGLASTNNPASFYTWQHEIYRFMSCLEVASPTSADWTVDTVDALKHWLPLFEKFGLCGPVMDSVNWTLSQVMYRLRDPGAHDLFHGKTWSLSEADLTQLQLVFDALQRRPDPLLRLYGLAGELAAMMRKEPLRSESLTTRLGEIKGLAKETIANPPCQKPDAYRIAVYQAWLDTVDTLADPVMRRREYQELFDFMLGRGEYVHWVVMAAIDPQPYTFARYRYSASVFPRNEKSPCDPVLCAQDLAHIQTLLGSPDCHKLIGPSDLWRGGVDQELHRVRQAIAEQQPGLIPPSAAPWSTARLLYEGPSPLLQPRVAGNSIWGLELTQGGAGTGQLRLVRVPLDGSPPQRYDRIPPDGPPDKFYGAITRDGVAVFPPDAAAMGRLTETNGLPSSHVSTVACCDGRLYAGIGENTGYHGTAGYLIVCELATGRVTVLASSMRKEKLSALDDVSPPFFIRQMIADPARHRVLFTVDIGEYKGGTPYTGLWSIDARDDKLTCLFPLNGYCEWISQIRSGEILFTRRLRADRAAYEVLSFNLEKNMPRLLSTPSPDLERLLIGNSRVYSIPWQSYPPHLILDGWLWVAGPFSRIPIDGGPREFLPSFVTGRPLVGYGQLRYLELLENSRQILAGVGNQLWLLDLKPKDAGAKDTSKVSP